MGNWRSEIGILWPMSEQLAIDGGPKVRELPYPPWPVLGEEDVEAVAEVLRSGKLTQLTGGAVTAFEESLRAALDARARGQVGASSH